MGTLLACGVGSHTRAVCKSSDAELYGVDRGCIWSRLSLKMHRGARSGLIREYGVRRPGMSRQLFFAKQASQAPCYRTDGCQLPLEHQSLPDTSDGNFQWTFEFRHRTLTPRSPDALFAHSGLFLMREGLLQPPSRQTHSLTPCLAKV